MWVPGVQTIRESKSVPSNMKLTMDISDGSKGRLKSLILIDAMVKLGGEEEGVGPQRRRERVWSSKMLRRR